MLSERITESMTNSSWIRAMFEEGEKLRAIHGNENVFDFSLGNPDVAPPKAVIDAFKKYAMDETPGLHRYMSNAGFMDVREAVAQYQQKESGVPLKGDHIIMTCGAAGGLNVVLRTIIDPGDEVIVLSPYFVEYLFYVDNFSGKVVIVNTSPEDFQLDLQELDKHITPRTKAVILNSPHNPTGVIYTEKSLRQMADLLQRKEKEYGKPIYVLSDEPYSKLIYDGAVLPQILQIFRNSFVVTSFSKTLSLPGERIGYIAVHPEMDYCSQMIGGIIFCNRILGFINAPALQQKAIADSLNAVVDVEQYQERRDFIYSNLTRIGFSCMKPEGTFYLFPKTLIPDDLKFVETALKHNILMTPGRGFGWPGYARLSFCVSLDMIKRSIPAFEALAAEVLGK